MKKSGLLGLVVLSMLVVGVGAVAVASLTSSTATLSEPLSATISDNLGMTYPGQSDTVAITITNAAPDVSYKVSVTTTVNAQDDGDPSNGVFDSSYVSITLDSSATTCTDNGDGTFTAPADGSCVVAYTVSVDGGAPVGSFNINFGVERVGSV